MFKKLSHVYPLQIELIPLCLLVLIIYLTLISYPGLPEMIPSHFNVQGLPDDWGNKNELFIYLGMGLFVYLLLTGIVLGSLLAQDPLKLINLPTGMKQRISPLQAEALRVYVIRCLLVMKIAVLGLNVFLLHNTIEVALGHAPGIGYWPFLFLLAVLAPVGLMLLKILYLSKPGGKPGFNRHS